MYVYITDIAVEFDVCLRTGYDVAHRNDYIDNNNGRFKLLRFSCNQVKQTVATEFRVHIIWSPMKKTTRNINIFLFPKVEFQFFTNKNFFISTYTYEIKKWYIFFFLITIIDIKLWKHVSRKNVSICLWNKLIRTVIWRVIRVIDIWSRIRDKHEWLLW